MCLCASACVLTVVCCVCVCVCMQSVRGMLENPTEAVSELSYFDCIDSVMENSKVCSISTCSQKSSVSFGICISVII